MILMLWSFFVLLALALFVVGYYMKNDLLRILATILFFFMGQNINSPGIEYVVGLSANTTLNSSVQAFVYATYVSHTYGFYMMIVALLTFVFIMMERLWASK